MKAIIDTLFERASIHDEEHMELALHVTYVLVITAMACVICWCVTSCFCTLCTPQSLRRFIGVSACILLFLALLAVAITTDRIEASIDRGRRLEHKAAKLAALLGDDDE